MYIYIYTSVIPHVYMCVYNIAPCLGMNGHPRARMKLILRQYETEVKIFNTRWFPASNYRFKWSNIASQGSNMRKTSQKSNFKKKLDFSIDPGGPGSHPGGSRANPGAEKHQKNEKIQNYKNYIF